MIATEPRISHEVFLATMKKIANAETVDELSMKKNNLISYNAISYHHLPPIGSREYNKKASFWTDGLPTEVLSFLERNKGKPDPLIDYVLAQGRPYWVSQLRDNIDPSNKNFMWFIEATLEYIGDPVVMPLQGPAHKRGFMLMNFEKPRAFYDEVFMWQLHAIIQNLHVKYCHIIESFQESVKLTPRENEVLELIAFGKTNPEIGKILGISTSTVSGYVKKIFLKLDVTDRVSAALQARHSTITI